MAHTPRKITSRKRSKLANGTRSPRSCLLLRARLVPNDLLRLHRGAETRVLRLHLALQVAAVVLLVHRAGDRGRGLLRVLADAGLRDGGLRLLGALRPLGALLQQDRLLRARLLNAQRNGLRTAEGAGGLRVQAGEVTAISVEQIATLLADESAVLADDLPQEVC